MTASPQPQTTTGSSLGVNLEKATVVGALGLAIGAAVTQQVLLVSLASMSLSVTAGLNMMNRKRLLEVTSQGYRSELQQLRQQVEAYQADGTSMADQTKAELTTLAGQVTTDRELLVKVSEQGYTHGGAIATLIQQTQEQFESLDSITAQLAETKVELTEQADSLRQDTEQLAAKEEQIESIVGELKSIDQITQAIRMDATNANLYYERGLLRVNLNRDEDLWVAIDDFSQAIALNPTHAHSLFQRGKLRSQLSEKRLALGDLRVAAKLYFEQGDLDAYEQAMELSQQQHHDLKTTQLPAESEEPVSLEGLFSD